MCLLVLAWNAHPLYRLIVAANRDEYHDRPAAPLAKWNAPDEILAGRDLRAGGTWLGVDKRRRFGVITNFRDLQRAQPGAPSRGGLIPAYLNSHLNYGGSAAAFVDSLAPDAERYSGFNLLLADDDALWYDSNRAEPFARRLAPGIHGLSNHMLDTPWPKLLHVRRGFEDWLSNSASEAEELFALLSDREPHPSDTSIPPDLPPELARALSAPFVRHPGYGTRCSSVLLQEPSGAMQIAERRFDANGDLVGEVQFVLDADEWP